MCHAARDSPERGRSGCSRLIRLGGVRRVAVSLGLSVRCTLRAFRVSREELASWSRSSRKKVARGLHTAGVIASVYDGLSGADFL